MSTDTSLIIFKAISNFTTELANSFEDKQRSLKLYSHLINKTTLAHEKPIEKHIDAFRTFCVTNRDAIVAKNHKLLTNHVITYSDRVYINMLNIFNNQPYCIIDLLSLSPSINKLELNISINLKIFDFSSIPDTSINDDVVFFLNAIC